jgi:hypothetical protein
MRKEQEILRSDSCLNKANPGEMLFVLLGRDLAAPATIKFWVAHRIKIGLNVAGDAQTTEALGCAATMEREQGS